MDSGWMLLLLGISGIASITAIVFLLRESFPGFFNPESVALQKLTESQAAIGEKLAGGKGIQSSERILQSIADKGLKNSTVSHLTIAKRLKYARWGMASVVFHAFEFFLSLFVFALLFGKVNLLVSLVTLASGPIFMRLLLTRSVDRRFNRFDADYPQLLMSMVGLLKTGMTPTQALEASARGLEPDSLVREEVQLMIERLRLGVVEEKSIGTFGEDIHHPEIELFVQALLLSRRLGGNLADTLERLAKQVRRRQYFRHSARASISLQRGSIWLIIAIMVALQCFLAYSSPELVFKALNTELGWQVWQGSFLLIGLAILWIRQVTRIKT